MLCLELPDVRVEGHMRQLLGAHLDSHSIAMPSEAMFVATILYVLGGNSTVST